MGRPRKENRWFRIPINVGPCLHDKIIDRCLETGKKRIDVIREAIEAGLDKVTGRDFL